MNVTRRARLLNHRALRDTTILNSPFSILNLFYKIKSSCPRFLLGQERIRSCGTTQIDANCVHSAHTSNNARSPDNGRSPRRSYLAEAVRLALLKSIHTVLACRNHTACGSLGGSVSLLLVFVIGLLGMVTVYSQNSGLSSAICEKQYIISVINSYYENEGRSIVFFCTLCYNG